MRPLHPPSYYQYVQRFFDSAMNRDQVIRKVKGTVRKDKEGMDGFFQVQNNLKKAVNKSNFPEFKRTAFTLIALANTGLHVIPKNLATNPAIHGINLPGLLENGILQIY